MRAHLQTVARQSGRLPAELATPPLPAALRYLLQWFHELASGRQQGMTGPQPLAWLETAAWALLTGERPAGWELAALKRLDALWLQAAAAAAAERSQPPR